jgi:hypothetical protein
LTLEPSAKLVGIRDETARLAVALFQADRIDLGVGVSRRPAPAGAIPCVCLLDHHPGKPGALWLFLHQASRQNIQNTGNRSVRRSLPVLGEPLDDSFQIHLVFLVG